MNFTHHSWTIHLYFKNALWKWHLSFTTFSAKYGCKDLEWMTYYMYKINVIFESVPQPMFRIIKEWINTGSKVKLLPQLIFMYSQGRKTTTLAWHPLSFLVYVNHTETSHERTPTTQLYSLNMIGTMAVHFLINGSWDVMLRETQ